MTTMTISGRRVARLLATVSVAALLSACAMTPEPFTQEEFATKAKADRAAMFAGQEALSKPLTLSDAVARVLMYNLDKRSKMMEETLALGDRRFVSILDAEGERFLIAMTPQGISLISRLDTPETGEAGTFDEALSRQVDLGRPVPVKEMEALLRQGGGGQ